MNAKNEVAEVPVLGGHGVDRRGAIAGITVILVPILAWILSLGVSYLVQDFVCSAAASSGMPPPGAWLNVLLVVLNVALLAVTVLAGVGGLLLALRSRRLTGPWLLAFLGWVGAGLAAMFAFGIVLIGANPLVFGACQ